MAYATITELHAFGASSAAFGSITDDAKTAALAAASVVVDGYLRSRFPRASFPLTSVGDDVKQAVCKLATYELLSVRGFNARAGADEQIAKRYDDAIAWCKAVSRGEVHLAVEPANPSPSTGMARVASNTRRGF